MGNLHTWLIILVIILVTVLLRFLPFIIFNDKNKTPKFIEKLAKISPYAIMGMLVIYCLKDVTFKNINSFFPSLISCIIVSVLYIWKRKTLLSIIIGTICYMLLVQFVF